MPFFRDLARLRAVVSVSMHVARCQDGDRLPQFVRAIDQDDGDETPRRRTVTRSALLTALLTCERNSEARLDASDELTRQAR